MRTQDISTVLGAAKMRLAHMEHEEGLHPELPELRVAIECVDREIAPTERVVAAAVQFLGYMATSPPTALTGTREHIALMDALRELNEAQAKREDYGETGVPA